MRAAVMRKFIFSILFAVGLWQFGAAMLIYAKAALAPTLIESAWSNTLSTGEPTKPWPWADTWPVARLQVPALAIDHFVLAGANGAALPFGPGMLNSGSNLHLDRSRIIAGHWDTHFGFLPRLGIGSSILLQSADGETRTYRVVSSRIADARDESLQIDPADPQLILVTCYPDGLLAYRGPLRLVVEARRDVLPASLEMSRAHSRTSLTSFRSHTGGT